MTARDETETGRHGGAADGHHAIVIAPMALGPYLSKTLVRSGGHSTCRALYLYTDCYRNATTN